MMHQILSPSLNIWSTLLSRNLSPGLQVNTKAFQRAHFQLHHLYITTSHVDLVFIICITYASFLCFFRPRKILTRHEYNGLSYNSSSSLRTTDQCLALSLLKDNRSVTSSTAVKEVHARNGLVICEVENVLTERQCNDIIKTSSTCSFQNMSNKYDPKKERNNSRLLVLDEDLSKHLWNQIGAILLQVVQDNNISLCPLGFDVLKGSWEFDGVNDAIRINRYSSDKSEYFAPHKDGQYCPSGDKRSIFSLVLYLNEGFKGGETCFYLPKGTKGQTKAMTVEEEIKAVGGLEKGFNLVTVTPTTGCAVLFSQNILHESTPLIMQKKSAHKIILKTDVMLSRKDKPFGFSVSLKERDDYFDCLNYFRKAQQKELSGETKEASELYERALSLRYCYPAALKNLEHPDLAVVSVLSTAIFPACVWENIFTYLNGQEAEMVVYAFPDLKPIRKLQEERFSLKLEAMPVNKRPLFYPKIDNQHGIYTCFEFSDADFFRANEEGCCRVAAIYSFFLLGHSPSDTMYTVRFNADTQEVCAMPLDKLLWDVFHKQPCYGAIYKVRQQSKVEDIGKDFANSVGRSYMALRHNAEFIGIDVSDTFRAKTIVTKGNDYSEGSSDESSDVSSDDDDSHSNEDSDASMPPKKKQKNGQLDENENKECGTIHVNGEIDVNVKNDIFLQMLDKIGSFRALDLEFEDGETLEEAINEMCDCLDDKSDQKPIKELYLKWLLERCSDRASISAAKVSWVKQSLEIDGDDICLCGIGNTPGDGCSQLSDVCEINTYNHLVFDFLENQLSVEHVQDENFGKSQNADEDPDNDCSSCYLSSVLRTHVKSQSTEKIRKALTHGEMKHFTVRIDPLAKAFVPFNHASCNCVFPSVKVNEYVNLRNYPYLNHLHLITQEIDDRVYVWSVYGGIVAL